MTDGAPLARKLQIKPGMKLKLTGAPAEIAEALRAEGVISDEGPDGAIVFCSGPADLEAAMARLLTKPDDDRLWWFAYRKGDRNFNRDAGWSAMTDRGYRGVRMIAFDQIWSGKRVRPISAVK